MPPALKGDQLLGPERPHYVDLLLAAYASIVEVLSQRLVFDVVPPYADSQPQPSAAKEVHLGSLLRNQGRLPLGQNEDARRQLQLLGDAGEVPE